MATSTETKIALLGKTIDDNQRSNSESFARIEKKVDENQVEIIKKMDKFAFETIKDHDGDIMTLRSEIAQTAKDLRAEFKPTVDQVEKDTKLVNAGGLKASNTLFGSVTKIILGALAVGVIILVVFALTKISPAIYGGAQ